MKNIKNITIDTTSKDFDELINVCNGNNIPYATISVTNREVEGTSFEIKFDNIEKLPETAVWNESRWGEGVWAGKDDNLDTIIKIMSNGGFPKNRANLTKGQKHLLRDAMILEAHIREKRDILISDDKKAFISHGKRDVFQKQFNIQILTKEEFLAKYKS